VGTDSRDEDDWVVRMAERAACCEVVRRAASRRRHAYAVRLNGGEMLIVAKELDARHGRIWPSIHDNLIKNIVRPIRLVSVVVLGLFAYQLFYQVTIGTVSVLRAHHSCFKAEAEVDSNPLVKCARQRLGILLKVKPSQEAERAKRECEDRRNDALKEPRRIQYGTVTTKLRAVSLGIPQNVGCLTARTMSNVWGFCAQSSLFQYFNRPWYAGFFSSNPAASNVLFSSMVSST
jgi:hypothetical protein